MIFVLFLLCLGYMIVLNNIPFYHRCEIQIRVSDIDINGHVNNVIYGHFFSLGRLYYFNRILDGRINWKEESMVIASSTINYLKPVYLDDLPVCFTKVLKIGNKSITMVQYLMVKDGSISATNDIVLVCYNSLLKQSIAVPPLWRKQIAELEQQTF